MNKKNLRISITLTEELLNKIYNNMKNNNIKNYVLIEPDFIPTESFLDEIVGHFSFLDKDKPLISKTIRPDILFLEYIQKNAENKNDEIRILNENGQIEVKKRKSMINQIGIRVIDIKLKRKENVGLRYYFETLFYTFLLASLFEI